jgi:DNA-binding CsgD family transcriptional regulator
MAHIAIFGYIVILMVGLWAISITHQALQRFHLPYLKFLMYYIIAFNVGVFVYLIAKYAVVNLWEQGFDPSSAVVLIPALFVVAFGMTYSLVNVVVRLKGQENYRALNGALAVAAIFFATGYAIGFFQFWSKATLKWLTATTIILVFTVLIVTLLLLIDLVVRAHGAFDRDRRRVVRGFGYLMLSGYVPYTVAALLPGSYDLHAALVTQLWLNLAPVVWIQRFFLPYHERLWVANSDRVLDILARDYKISKREREVIQLILEGKSNKQIQERLFISPHTVKNHIYNLYQKIGIKSRSELMFLVMKRNDMGSGDQSGASLSDSLNVEKD